MGQVESICATFVEGGYGRDSRELTMQMVKFVELVAMVREELKPTNLKFGINVQPNTRVEITIKSP